MSMTLPKIVVSRTPQPCFHSFLSALAPNAPLHGVGDDLRVPAADVEHYRVSRTGGYTAHLDVRHTVVHGDEGHLPQQAEGARADRARAQRPAHARACSTAG